MKAIFLLFSSILFLFCNLVSADEAKVKPFLEKRFTDIHESKMYAYGKETISGVGASLHDTERIRTLLPQLFHDFKITSVLDVGCGDFNWIRHIIEKSVVYVGAVHPSI